MPGCCRRISPHVNRASELLSNKVAETRLAARLSTTDAAAAAERPRDRIMTVSTNQWPHTPPLRRLLIDSQRQSHRLSGRRSSGDACSAVATQRRPVDSCDSCEVGERSGGRFYEWKDFADPVSGGFSDERGDKILNLAAITVAVQGDNRRLLR